MLLDIVFFDTHFFELPCYLLGLLFLGFAVENIGAVLQSLENRNGYRSTFTINGDPVPLSCQELFKFSVNPKSEINPKWTWYFFTIVIYERDPLSAKLQSKQRSESFNKSQTFHSARLTSPSRPSSFRAPATGSYRYQSGGSRKYNVLIGLTKIQPEMDLSEIRKRQGRRGPVPLFPVAGVEEPVIASGGRSHWGLLRPLRSKSRLGRVLALASFGCFPRV